MIDKQINGKIYKIKEEMNVKTWLKYLKVIAKLQKLSQAIMKELNLSIEQIQSNPEETALKTDPELLAQLSEIEYEQFLIMYEGMVIEPKLKKEEIDELPRSEFQELSEIFTRIGTNAINQAKIDEIKKKPD